MSISLLQLERYIVRFDNLYYFIISFIITWILAALAIYIAGKAISGKEATFGEALIIALIGPILVAISSAFITALFGPFLGLILAFLVWLWVTKSVFGVGWLAAFAITIIAIIVLIIIEFLVGGFLITYDPFPMV
jgi:hypothetical protein